MINRITTDVDQAVECLKNGHLVVFPTETVYGLGADARNINAIKNVFSVKGRPTDHPLIVHIADAKQMPEWAINIPRSAWQLAEHFWPGPLTLVLEKRPEVSELITGGQTTVALRVPNHPLTLNMLRQFNGGIVGPSANKYGRISPTTALHVNEDLGTEVAAILDGGPCALGIESTIIYLSNDTQTILREGSITAAQIAKVLGTEPKIKDRTINLRVSGDKDSHYAPRTPLYLMDYDKLLENASENTSVISFKARPVNLSSNIFWQQVAKDPQIYAHDLYANLRIHDSLNKGMILLEKPENTLAWSAINDRLTRASFKQ